MYVYDIRNEDLFLNNSNKSKVIAPQKRGKNTKHCVKNAEKRFYETHYVKANTI